MAEMEQLHTAIPFGEGELSEELRLKLKETAPNNLLSNFLVILNICFAFALNLFGISLLQHNPNARNKLLYWATTYIVLLIGGVIINWFPRWELVQENSEIQGMFLAQLLISMPMYLILPIFLLIFLNKKQIRSEIATWR